MVSWFHFSLIESAIEVKNSLKESATYIGLEVTDSPTDMEIGVEDLLDFEDMMSLTPVHTFFIFENVN